MRCCSIHHVVRRSGLTAALFLFLVLAIGSAIAAGFVGQAVKILGQVSVNRDGSDMTVGPGTALQLGDVIKTGPGARLRLRFVDGSILTLGENTQLSIDIFAVDGTNKSRTVVLTLLTGIVNAAAAKSGENKFDYQIKTASAYSAVRGTQWILAAPTNAVKGTVPNATSLYVLGGQVELGSESAQPALVNAGNWASVDAQGKLSPIQPTTPEILQPVLAATSDSGGGGTVPSVPTTVPNSPAPTQMPSLPQEQEPTYQRALKNDGKQGGYKSDDKGHTSN